MRHQGTAGAVHCQHESEELEARGVARKSRWEVLDTKINVNDLSGQAAAVGVWPIDSRLECKFIRLSSTGPSASGNQFLTLSYFDIFGSLLQA
jgi:hypothetical protein